MTSKTNLPRRERGSSLTVHDERLLLVRLKDPLTGVEFLTPPGGGVEPSESLLQTALRETREETGYEVEFAGGEPTVLAYEFDWNGKVHACRTTFYLCRLVPARPAAAVLDAVYNIGALWVPLSEVTACLAYHREIQRAVLACLGQRAP